jgi:hypothetical protein
MRSNEIEEALRRQPTWEPPRDFARRVAHMAQPLPVDAPVHLRDVLTLVAQAFQDALLNSAATLSGLRWTLRQYWLLLSH